MTEKVPTFYTLRASLGQKAPVLTNESIPISGLCFSVLHHSQPRLDRERDWMPRADPGEDTVSYCVPQRCLQGDAELCFPQCDSRAALSGSISGASLLSRPVLLGPTPFNAPSIRGAELLRLSRFCRP